MTTQPPTEPGAVSRSQARRHLIQDGTPEPTAAQLAHAMAEQGAAAEFGRTAFAQNWADELEQPPVDFPRPSAALGFATLRIHGRYFNQPAMLAVAIAAAVEAEEAAREAHFGDPTAPADVPPNARSAT